jgi:hypothetical protein
VTSSLAHDAIVAASHEARHISSSAASPLSTLLNLTSRRRDEGSNGNDFYKLASRQHLRDLRSSRGTSDDIKEEPVSPPRSTSPATTLS